MWRRAARPASVTANHEALCGKYPASHHHEVPSDIRRSIHFRCPKYTISTRLNYSADQYRASNPLALPSIIPAFHLLACIPRNHVATKAAAKLKSGKNYHWWIPWIPQLTTHQSQTPSALPSSSSLAEYELTGASRPFAQTLRLD